MICFEGRVANRFVLLALWLGTVGLMSSNASAGFVALLESDADEPFGQEIFLVSYNSLTDLQNDNQASASFSQLDVNPVFSAGGLAYDGSQYHLLLESDADEPSG
jgi:hypothetical protein